MKARAPFVLLGLALGAGSGSIATAQSDWFGRETQLTAAAYGHVLTNANVWSPDGARIVYDIRDSDDFTGTRIEDVAVSDHVVRVLYASRPGETCGIVSYNPVRPLVAFVASPEQPTPSWHYGFSRRHGLIVDARAPGRAQGLDAETYVPPFVAGALRGGSHVHLFDAHGEWVSFTYEDDVLESLGTAPGHDRNARNVAVAVPDHPVAVDRRDPRNVAGTYFTVVATRTVDHPAAGSDEIGRAFEEGWVGRDGYRHADGTWQRHALAFQGLVSGPNGETFPEVYVVDLPEDLTKPGAGPLEGTAVRRPWPPRGASQRRLTHTAAQKYPGIAATPRHWLRVSPDGRGIAFLLRDEAGRVQLNSVSPNGGAIRQVTRNPWSVASTFSWRPDGRWIAYVMDHSIFATEAATGRTLRLTPRSSDASAPSALACVFSPTGEAIAFTRVVGPAGAGHSEIFTVSFSPP